MSEGLLKYSSTEGLNVQLGQGGYIYRAPTILTGYADDIYVAITALGAANGTAAVIILFPADEAMGDGVSINLPIGTTVYGRWKIIALAQNEKCILYKGS